MFSQNYAKHYDLLNSAKQYKKEIEFVYRWAGEPTSLLDIGCGTASYWKYFPHKVQVLGIEKSPDMILASEHQSRIIEEDITTYRPQGKFNCVTALFDVINYIPDHKWWKHLPLEKGGLFIFDVLDKDKANEEEFRQTLRRVSNISRHITPMVTSTDSKIDLQIILQGPDFLETEIHHLYLFSYKDIKKFAGRHFEIVETKKGKGWQRWYKLRRR